MKLPEHVVGRNKALATHPNGRKHHWPSAGQSHQKLDWQVRQAAFEPKAPAVVVAEVRERLRPLLGGLDAQKDLRVACALVLSPRALQPLMQDHL